jgi:hypothetical protein
MRQNQTCLRVLTTFTGRLFSALVVVFSPVFATTTPMVYAESTLLFSNFGVALPESERIKLNLFGVNLSKGCSLASIFIDSRKRVPPKINKTTASEDRTIVMYDSPVFHETSRLTARRLRARAELVANHLVNMHGYDAQRIFIAPINRIDRYEDINEVRIEGTSYVGCDFPSNNYGKIR